MFVVFGGNNIFWTNPMCSSRLPWCIYKNTRAWTVDRSNNKLRTDRVSVWVRGHLL